MIVYVSPGKTKQRKTVHASNDCPMAKRWGGLIQVDTSSLTVWRRCQYCFRGYTP